MDYESKYLKYKSKYKLLKSIKINNNIQHGGAQSLYIEYINENINKDSSKTIQEKLIKLLNDKYLFDKNKINYEYSKEDIDKSIQKYFSSNYHDFMGGIIKRNKENLIKEIQNIIKDIIKNKQINKQTDRYTIYNKAQLILDKYNDLFVRLMSPQDNTLGDKAENNTNIKIKEILKTLDISLLYMTNIPYDVLVGDRDKNMHRDNFKKEIDSIIFVKNTENIYVPIIVTETKNNINLISKDIHNYSGLINRFTTIETITGINTINAKNKDTNKNEQIKIDLSNLKNMYIYYCVNIIDPRDIFEDVYTFFSSNDVQLLIGSEIQHILYKFSKSNMFTSYKALDEYYKNCFNQLTVHNSKRSSKRSRRNKKTQLNIIDTTDMNKIKEEIQQIKIDDNLSNIKEIKLEIKLDIKLNIEYTTDPNIDTSKIFTPPKNLELNLSILSNLIDKRINYFKKFIDSDKVDILYMT